MRLIEFLSARRLFAGVAVGLIALGALPAGAAATSLPINFSLTVNSPGDCIAVFTAAENPTQVTLRDGAGHIKAQGTVPSDDVFFCLDGATWISAGDKLKADDGTYSRTFTVPDVSIKVDRANDLYLGTGPAGRTVVVGYPEAIFGDVGLSHGVRVGPDGTWAFDPHRDLRWGMDGYLSWKSPNGDRVYAYGIAPYITLTIGKSTFSGWADSAAEFEATIQGDRLGTKSVTADVRGSFSGKFHDSLGRKVPVFPGDEFSATDLASDAHWVVPGIEATANALNDKVKGTCEDTGSLSSIFRIDVVRDGHTRGRYIGPGAQDGQFNVDFGGREYPGFHPANIRSGDTIVVGCMLATGDWVSGSFTTP